MKYNYGKVNIREGLPDKNSRSKVNKNRNRSKELDHYHSSFESGLKLYELDTQSRSWYTANRRRIEEQSLIIYSYDVITRFMTQEEINARIRSYISKMIEPKHWLSLMVDEVYEKLKEKYRREYY